MTSPKCWPSYFKKKRLRGCSHLETNMSWNMDHEISPHKISKISKTQKFVHCHMHSLMVFLFCLIWMFPKIVGETPQIIHFNSVFHYFHHPFWGFSPYFWKHPYMHPGKKSTVQIPASEWWPPRLDRGKGQWDPNPDRTSWNLTHSTHHQSAGRPGRNMRVFPKIGVCGYVKVEMSKLRCQNDQRLWRSQFLLYGCFQKLWVDFPPKSSIKH